jgi:hypothetical protein
MTHLRHIVLATFVVALVVAPAAGAQNAPNGGGVVTPSRDGVLNQAWALCYELPVPDNPCAGPLNGDHCMTVAPRVIQIVGPFTCTVKQGTALALDVGTAWSEAEDSALTDEASQRAAAVASDEAILAFSISVDGGDPVDVHTPRFELFPPQRTVQLPVDNILGVPAQTTTFTAHGWGAIVRNLRPGRHTIVGSAVFPDGSASFPHYITVVRAGRSG